MNTKNIIIAILAVLLLACGGYIAKNQALGAASGPVHYQTESFLQGLAVGSRNQLTISNTGVISAVTGAFSGLLTNNGGTLKSYTNASSSVTTGTLAQADILNYDTLLLTPSGAAATKTLTLPATSTLTTMVPTAGDTQDLCIYNATGTAASTITLAAGTGIDLETVATSTTSGVAGVLVIPANGYACLKFIRQTNTDIGALMTSYINAD